MTIFTIQTRDIWNQGFSRESQIHWKNSRRSWAGQRQESQRAKLEIIQYYKTKGGIDTSTL